MERMTMPNLLVLIMIGCGLLSLIFFIFTFMAIRKKKLISSTIRLLVALLCLALAALFGTITVATKGYLALTHEETAAIVKTKPLGENIFIAHFKFPDGHEDSYRLAGDSLYVDAHILKWKPIVNILGLHTVYELDGFSGRYTGIQEELTAPRTMFLVSQKKPLNMFTLRQKYSFLKPLLDVEYGSAAFIKLEKPAKFEIKVSTTGLLIREIQPC